MKKMTEHNIRLTAGDLSNLWSTYVTDTMAICVMKYFREKVEDSQIKTVVEHALSLSQKHVEFLAQLFESEDIPVPLGFTNEDVNIHAPTLFSDVFIIQYIKMMTRIGLVTYGAGLWVAARADDRRFYNDCIKSTVELDNMTTDLLLEKGLYQRAPVIPNAKRVEFVEKQGFLAGWFGNRRPLTAMEIIQLYTNTVTNSIGKALMQGFSQVAKLDDIRTYFVRGRDIADKHMTVFSGILQDDSLPAVSVWDSEVTDSLEPPFSEKLMMHHVASLTALGIADYGASLSVSPRRDIGLHMNRLMAEVELYAEDGANLLIKHGWLEKPPSNVDRDQLAGI